MYPQVSIRGGEAAADRQVARIGRALATMLGAALMRVSSRDWWTCSTLISTIGFVLVLGCSPSSNTPAQHNVVLIIIDTLRADHLHCYGYPRETSPVIDELAAEGARFTNAFTAWPETSPSVASMLTGLYPQRTGVVRATPNRLPERLITLPEVLQAAGYQTIAAVENPVLSSELNYNQGFELYLGSWDRKRWQDADKLATNWLRTQRDPGRPFFLYVHLIDPHAPYEPRSYDRVFVGDDHYDATRTVEVKDREFDAVGGFPGFSRLGDRRELAFYVAQYDAEIRSVDARTGNLLEVLDQLGLRAGTLVIFSSDHGEGFGEHNYYWHGLFPYDETSRVPLIVSGRGVKPRAMADLVSLVDLTPTILDFLGLPRMDELDGVSLKPLLLGERARLDRQWIYTESGKAERYQRSVRNQDYKLIFVPDGREQTLLRGAEYELYHVADRSR